MAYKGFKVGDIVSATLEKLPGEEDAGLRMECRHGRVFISDVEELFRDRFESRGLPVLPGDQLIEFCGKRYTEYRNINEIRKVHDESDRIWLKVLRTDPDDSSQSTDSEWDIQSDEEEEEVLCIDNGPAIEPGDVCEIEGLVNKAELNGKRVEVVRPVKGKQGRWQVRPEGAEKLVSVPEENLVLLQEEPLKPGDVMMLADLVNKAELNGETVEVVRPVKGKAGKWQVKVRETGKIISVSENNLVPCDEEEGAQLLLGNGSDDDDSDEEEKEKTLMLQNGPAVEAGAQMMLEGMERKPELNGESVEVVRPVKGKPGKWQVKVEETGKLVVVSENNLVAGEGGDDSEEDNEEEESEEEESEEEESENEDDEEESEIEAGAVMELQAMDKKPHLNGETVEVVREVKGKPGKWQVRVQDTGKVVIVSSHQLTN